MGFLGNILSATVKTVLSPIAIVKDAAAVVVGEDPTATKQLIDSATDDLCDAVDDLTGN